MQFTKPYKIAIAAGRITASFRTWRRPQARVGGQYNIPPHGAIEVTAIAQIKLGQATAQAISAAGFEDLASLCGFLRARPDTQVYQVTFRFLGAEAVKRPDTSTAPADALEDLSVRLNRMDRVTPWTQQILALIAHHPGRRAGDLALMVDMDTPTFKRNVRKLKGLGLTLSLETGYELSERGAQWLKRAQP